MDFQTLENLRMSHSAWRLLWANFWALIASFLDRVSLKPNVWQMSESNLARHLDDDLSKLRRELGEGRFPRGARLSRCDEYGLSWQIVPRGCAQL